MKAQFSLTPSESKRLIGKSVSQHPKVKKALRTGIIAIGLGSTNAFVIEEILKKKMEKEKYVAGFVDGKGPCVVPASERVPEVVLKNGKVVNEKPGEIVKKMGAGDIFIKGANALDFDGVAGVMMASETGGTVAEVLGIIKARGINLIIPVGLEKLVPYSINEVSKETGIFSTDYSIGIPVGVMPVAGEVITEIEALETFGVSAIVIGSGGLGDGESSKVFQIEGEKKKARIVIDIIRKIKGEKRVKALRSSCKTCVYKQCPNVRKR
ncbi:MAG: hypothetical protein V3R93_02845 [Candidatus Hydrothermarchaeaceae archaeon]